MGGVDFFQTAGAQNTQLTREEYKGTDKKSKKKKARLPGIESGTSSLKEATLTTELLQCFDMCYTCTYLSMIHPAHQMAAQDWTSSIKMKNTRISSFNLH
jgi:hypothetical protein